MNKLQWLGGVALVSLLTLSGCGGGGGSAPAATPTPAPAPTVPVDTRTGLVPDAGAPGAILYAEAAALRVLRDQASWTYHGIDQQNGEASATGVVEYFDTVKHSTVAGAIVEKANNALNSGADAGAAVRYEGGAYIYADKLPLSDSLPPLLIDVIELRSPVRVNDQYTSIDKRVTNSGNDFDGDKVNDAVDIAMYARVAGEELVDLPNRLHVKTVRVDMVIKLRIVLSTTGGAGPVFTSLRSTWYAPGVGIVKIRDEQPNPIDPKWPNRVVTEELQNYDGGSDGLGHTAAARGLFPVGGSGAGTALPVPTDAVAFDTTAVVLSGFPGDRPTDGFTVGQLDQRGAVLAARTYTAAELFGSTLWAYPGRLLRVGEELRILARTDLGIQMAGLDATGQRITLPARVLHAAGTFEADGNYEPFHAAADGSGFWLTWLRTSPGPTSLMLQRFDSAGAAQGSAHTLASNVAPIFHNNLALAVSENRVAVSWLTSIVSDTRRFAVLDKTTGALLLNSNVAAPQPDCTKVVPLALQPGMALACYSPYTNYNVSAARLDATGAPLLAAGGTLADEHLKTDWLTALSRPVFAGLNGQLVAAGFHSGPYWWRARGNSGFLMVMQTSGTGAMTTEPTLLARIPDGVDPRFVLGLGNRLLIVGGEDSTSSGALRTMVVWRPN